MFMTKRTLSLGVCVVHLLLLTLLCQADTRGDFLKLIDRPKVPLRMSVGDPANATAETPRPFAYASEAGQRVFGISMGASVQRRPAIILLHGTGGTKSDMIPLMKMFAAKGFFAVAIDGRYHGDRTQARKGSAEYEDAILRAYKTNTATSAEHPFFYDTVWDVMRLVDILETRSDVDPKRIGLMGISKGGIETYLTAAVDPRIAAAVPCIGLQSFKWAVDNEMWMSRIGTIKNAFAGIAKEEAVDKPDAALVRKFYDKVAPGIAGQFDGPEMVKLIAPRPLLAINGDSDDRTPLPGLKLCAEAAQQAYKAAGAEDHFVLRVQAKTGHKVNPDSEQAAVEWFVKWLKP